MDNLIPRLQRLVTQLTGQEAPGRAAAPPDPATTETAYRQTLRRWFEVTAQGSKANREEVTQVYQHAPMGGQVLRSNIPRADVAC